jgi:hypothetical protein
MTGSLYREDVTPLPKRQRRRKACSYVLCTEENLCVFCRNSENRRRGLRTQRLAKRGINTGQLRNYAQGSNEENWRGPFATEVKSGKQTSGVARCFLDAEKQMLVRKAIGDPRPMRVIAMPNGFGSDGIVMVRLSTWRKEVEPLFTEDV